MDLYHLNDTAWGMVFIMVVFEPKMDLPENKFLKYALKLTYVNFWHRNNDVTF